MDGWAAWVGAHHDGLTSVLCGSRRAHSNLMKAGHLAQEELVVGYAVNNRAAYTNGAAHVGMAVINFKTGKVAKVTMPNRLLAVHGGLMVLAFVILLPLGLLASRHKWLFVDEEFGELSPWWDIIHLGLLIIAASAGLASMLVVVVVFGNSNGGSLNSAHSVLGMIAIALSILLVSTYGLRPFVKPAPGHSHPLMTPLKAGSWVTLLAGWTALFLGCGVIHENWAVPHSTWLLPCVLLCALIAALAVLLELRLQQLVRSGAYNPKTCTRSNAGPALPSAYPICHVSRAGRSSGAAEPKSLIDKLELSAHNFIKSGLMALGTGPHGHDGHSRGGMSLPSSMPGVQRLAAAATAAGTADAASADPTDAGKLPWNTENVEKAVSDFMATLSDPYNMQ
eukprot:gene2390-2694_t